MVSSDAFFTCIPMCKILPVVDACNMTAHILLYLATDSLPWVLIITHISNFTMRSAVMCASNVLCGVISKSCELINTSFSKLLAFFKGIKKNKEGIWKIKGITMVQWTNVNWNNSFCKSVATGTYKHHKVALRREHLTTCNYMLELLLYTTNTAMPYTESD